MPKYCVTVTRHGWMFVEAASEAEAMAIADHQMTDTVIWSDDWSTTDIEENEDGREYITEKAFE